MLEPYQANYLSKGVEEALFKFLTDSTGAKRMDFDWGCIYWVGAIVRVDIKKEAA